MTYKIDLSPHLPSHNKLHYVLLRLSRHSFHMNADCVKPLKTLMTGVM